MTWLEIYFLGAGVSAGLIAGLGLSFLRWPPHEIEMLREALARICLNASIQPDAAMKGSTDCYAVPMDDIQHGHAVLGTP